MNNTNARKPEENDENLFIWQVYNFISTLSNITSQYIDLTLQPQDNTTNNQNTSTTHSKNTSTTSKNTSTTLSINMKDYSIYLFVIIWVLAYLVSNRCIIMRILGGVLGRLRGVVSSRGGYTIMVYVCAAFYIKESAKYILPHEKIDQIHSLESAIASVPIVCKQIITRIFIWVCVCVFCVFFNIIGSIFWPGIDFMHCFKRHMYLFYSLYMETENLPNIVGIFCMSEVFLAQRPQVIPEKVIFFDMAWNKQITLYVYGCFFSYQTFDTAAYGPMCLLYDQFLYKIHVVTDDPDFYLLLYRCVITCIFHLIVFNRNWTSLPEIIFNVLITWYDPMRRKPNQCSWFWWIMFPFLCIVYGVLEDSGGLKPILDEFCAFLYNRYEDSVKPIMDTLCSFICEWSVFCEIYEHVNPIICKWCFNFCMRQSISVPIFGFTFYVFSPKFCSVFLLTCPAPNVTIQWETERLAYLALETERLAYLALFCPAPNVTIQWETERLANLALN